MGRLECEREERRRWLGSLTAKWKMDFSINFAHDEGRRTTADGQMTKDEGEGTLATSKAKAYPS